MRVPRDEIVVPLYGMTVVLAEIGDPMGEMIAVLAETWGQSVEMDVLVKVPMGEKIGVSAETWGQSVKMTVLRDEMSE